MRAWFLVLGSASAAFVNKNEVSADVAVKKSPSAFHWGHAVYTYGPLLCDPSNTCAVVPSCNRASYAPNIEKFNKADGGDFSVVYSYGGDVELWAEKKTPKACDAPASTNMSKCNVSVYLDPNNLRAAEVYKNVEDVKSITMLLDGRMDGWNQIETYGKFDNCSFGNFYSNLQNLTDVSLRRLANDTVKLYCANDVVDGIQVDLEPYRGIYQKPLSKYVGYLSEFMRDENKTTGCRDEKHPEGRSVSYYAFAHDIANSTNVPVKEFNEKLGPNGHYVFSGYDLFPKKADGGFMFNTPSEFAERLRREITYFRKVVGTTKKFVLALPMGASCHEYEHYVPMSGVGCGPACRKIASNYTMDQYVNKAFEVLLDPETTKSTDGLFCMKDGESQFLGIAWWSFSHQMTYPPMKWFDNEFLPAQPPPKALDAARKQIPLLSGGVTCK